MIRPLDHLLEVFLPRGHSALSDYHFTTCSHVLEGGNARRDAVI
jgi:hypothetical protein